MKIEEVNRILVDFLRTNMPSITGIDWTRSIYIDYPRDDATFPRISISNAGHSTDPAGIGELQVGELGEWQSSTYDVDVWVKKGNEFQIIPLPASKHAGTALRDYLGDQVIQSFMNGRKWLKTNKQIVDVKIVSSVSLPYMDANELFRRTITINVYYFRTKVNSP